MGTILGVFDYGMVKLKRDYPGIKGTKDDGMGIFDKIKKRRSVAATAFLKPC
jgi:hypothetical protein